MQVFRLEHDDAKLNSYILDVLSDANTFRQLSDTPAPEIWARQEIEELPEGCLPENKTYYFCQADSQILGLCILFRDFAYPDFESGTTTISLFLIKEQLQRKNLGSKFYKALEKSLVQDPKTKTLRLGILKNNTAALAFWQKHDYSLLETKKKFYVYKKACV